MDKEQLKDILDVLIAAAIFAFPAISAYLKKRKAAKAASRRPRPRPSAPAIPSSYNDYGKTSDLARTPVSYIPPQTSGYSFEVHEAEQPKADKQVNHVTAMAMPFEEGARVTSDQPEENFACENIFEQQTAPATADDIRRAVIWSEILNRRY